MEADGLINLFVQLASTLYVVRSKPTADAFGLKIAVLMNRNWIALMTLLFGGVSLGNNARAEVIAVGMNAFPASSMVIDFTGLPLGLEVNGLTISGVRFDFTVGGTPLNEAVVLAGGTGGNNVSSPAITQTSLTNPPGILAVTLPSAVNLFGYGFGLLSTETTVANATSISAFSGTTLLGSVSFSGSRDPNFTGGFAGISSTTPFDIVALTFNQMAGPRPSSFSVDNLRFAAVPEPSTFLLVLGVAAVICCWRSRLRVRD